MFQVSDFRRDSYEHNGLCGRNESVPLAKSAGSGRDVFGNKNGASSEGGSRMKSEQSEGAGAVSGRAAGAVAWLVQRKKHFSWHSSFESTWPKDISVFLLKGLPFASLEVKAHLC
jgi:hypothetical protein